MIPQSVLGTMLRLNIQLEELIPYSLLQDN